MRICKGIKHIANNQYKLSALSNNTMGFYIVNAQNIRFFVHEEKLMHNGCA